MLDFVLVILAGVGSALIISREVGPAMWLMLARERLGIKHLPVTLQPDITSTTPGSFANAVACSVCLSFWTTALFAFIYVVMRHFGAADSFILVSAPFAANVFVRFL